MCQDSDYPTTNVYKHLQPTTNTYHPNNARSLLHICGTMEIRQPLIPGNTYHICTRSNGCDVLFHTANDYGYFRRKMEERLTEAWEILAYVLLPGEIHLAVKIVKAKIDGETVNHAILLGHLLNGYVQHHNYVHNRTGSLLNRSFRRELLETTKDIQDLICRIHNLPVAQKLVKRKEDWAYSSFRKLSNRTLNSAQIAVVISIFGGSDKFEAYHLREDVFSECILIPKTWIRKYTLMELLFLATHPLGGHRWSRRERPPT